MKFNISVVGGQVVIEDHWLMVALTSADAFDLAEQICTAAYVAQGGPAKDPEERDEQQLARDRRRASSFEELHCLIRDIADDWHREAVRRRDGTERGEVDQEFCDANKAVALTFATVLKRIKDWDY